MDGGICRLMYDTFCSAISGEMFFFPFKKKGAGISLTSLYDFPWLGASSGLSARRARPVRQQSPFHCIFRGGGEPPI